MRKHITFPALSSLSCFLRELAIRLLMWQCSLGCKLLIIGPARRAEGFWRFMAMVFFFLANELCKEVLTKSVQNKCSPLFLLRGLASSVTFFAPFFWKCETLSSASCHVNVCLVGVQLLFRSYNGSKLLSMKTECRDSFICCIFVSLEMSILIGGVALFVLFRSLNVFFKL